MGTYGGPIDSTCGALLRQLQIIWDESGETDEERDRMLLRLEEECLNVYRRTVEEANRARVALAQAATDAEAEVVTLCAKLGEPYAAVEARSGTLRDQLAAFKPHLERLRARKEERILQFCDIKKEIAILEADLDGRAYDEVEGNSWSAAAEADLTLKRLEDLHAHFEDLQREKSNRLTKILELAREVHDLCSVLGLDFQQTIMAIHPSLIEVNGGQVAKSVSPETLRRLRDAVKELVEEKRQRIAKVSSHGAKIVELWTLLDTPETERTTLMPIVEYINAAVDEVQEPNILSESMIAGAAEEVVRLETVKSSRMKELVRKKRMDLEAICQEAHFPPPENTSEEQTSAIIEAGLIDPQQLLSTLEAQIAAATEEAQSRKDLMKEVNKWCTAIEEEDWLEQYNMDVNRFTAKGGHADRRRAERARGLINKIPELMEKVIKVVRAWEKEHRKPFYFDGMKVTDMVATYKDTVAKKEEEKKLLKEKKLQDKKNAGDFGGKPKSATKAPNPKQGGGSPLTPASRRLSLGGPQTSPDTIGGGLGNRSPQHAAGGGATKTPGSGMKDLSKIPPSRLGRAPPPVPPNVVALQNREPPSTERLTMLDRYGRTTAPIADDSANAPHATGHRPLLDSTALNGREDVGHVIPDPVVGISPPTKHYNHHTMDYGFSHNSENVFQRIGDEGFNSRRATLAYGDVASQRTPTGH